MAGFRSDDGRPAQLGRSQPRVSLLALAAALFAAVFTLRLLVSDPSEPLSLLYALPIALVAIEFGLAWGLAAAALALGLFGFWDAFVEEQESHGIVDYLTRGAAFVLLGVLVGALADRVRRVSSESTRFFELSVDLLCTANFEGRFTRLNRAWEDTLGYSREVLLSRPFIEFVHPEDRARTEAEAAKLATGAEDTIGFENRYRRKDGSYRTLLWSATGVPEDDLIYAVAKDITDRQRMEERTLAAREDAERANRSKSEFLSRMSHELRTPLNSIIGFGQLLEMDGLSSGQRENVGRILRGGRHLLDLINEILDISRIEAGEMSVSLEPVPVDAMIAEVLDLLRRTAEERGVRIEIHESARARSWAWADQQRLRQILLNLVSNAVKYNREGGRVTVSVAKEEERVQILVSDTGRGMTDEQLELLFTPFARLGAELTDTEGTGLGLTLSKRLAEAMGGELMAQSEPDEGSTFTVSLAVPPDSEMAREPEPSVEAITAVEAESPRRQILYIEDNVANLKLVEAILAHRPGVELIAAMNAKLGLELARQHRPDLLLLDLHLPGMPGREALQLLRSNPDTREIPVVVVSADATPRQIKRLLDAGARDYLTKPLDVHRFLEVVDAALGVHAGSADR